MNSHQEWKKPEDRVPVSAFVVQQFFNQNAQQANNESDELPIELTNATGTYLDQIIEDCLLKIFEVKSLSMMDLCSLAETCRRFQQISQRVFPNNLTIECAGGYDIVSTKYSNSENRPLEDIERIFKNFGTFLSEITISNLCTEKPDFPVNFITEYCGDTLETLKMLGWKIPAVCFVQPKKLQLLDLSYCFLVDDPVLFADLGSLIELKVNSVTNWNSILDNIFPKLERFTLLVNSCSQIEQRLSTFISHHTRLKMIDIGIWRADETVRFKLLQLLPVIANRCTELEELSLNLGLLNASALQTLQALESLTILKLQFANCEVLKSFATLTQLRELHFIHCDLPEDSSQFESLDHLAKLQIRKSYRTDSIDVVGIVGRLLNLEELEIEDFVLDEETFLKIVDVVEERPNVLTLKCKFNFDLNSKSRDENRKVQLMSLY